MAVKYSSVAILFLFEALSSNAAVTCDSSSADIGCFQDYEDGVSRILDYGPYDLDGGVTVEGCMERCYAFGMKYSGVEFGNQCFCGNELQAPAVETDASECDTTPCEGDESTNCGGANRIRLLNTTCSGQVIPNYFGCQDDTSKALPYCDTTLSIDERFENFKSLLTLTEKIALISPQEELGNTCNAHTGSVDRIGLPQFMWLTETNTAVASSCIKAGQCGSEFSGPMSLGASFNRTSWYLKGKVFGTEQRAYMNINWHRGTGLNDYIGLTAYGPNINNQRDPRFGRSSELPGEDPFLSGTYATEMLSGMMERDSKGRPKVLAYVKHFTAYSRETDRGHDTYNITQHDLFESYLSQYKMAFTSVEGLGAMCSYNGINGAPSCANTYLLNDILRTQWNTNAHITTDCGAVANLLGDPVNAANDMTAASMSINNGSDVEMGGTIWQDNMQLAIDSGLTDESFIDASLERGYKPHFVAGRFDDPNDSEWGSFGLEDINSLEHQQIVHEAALQGLVLLKNSNQLLPLQVGAKKIAVVGPQGMAQAGLFSDYENDESCFGGGHDCIQTIFNAIQLMNGQNSDDDDAVNSLTQFSMGVEVDSLNSSGIPAALSLVEECDIAILVLGITKDQEKETEDRTDTSLPGLQNYFAHQVLALGKPTIMILTNGGQLAIDSFVEGAQADDDVDNGVYPDVIVEAFNPNGVGAAAIAEALFATPAKDSVFNDTTPVNRWGKLPYTMYPHNYILQQNMTNYHFAPFPGRTYKYYHEKQAGQVLYPFGYGLSLTTFGLECVQTEGPQGDDMIDRVEASTSNFEYQVNCSVTNTGDVFPGDEVVMVFHNVSQAIRDEAEHAMPLKELVDFERVGSLQPGESKVISFNFNQSFFDMIDENGEERLYEGEHSLIFTNGVSEKVVLPFAIILQ